ncbi:sulfite exporter TauE/SafE family protein [Bordetella sp. FB-8]|uniref:sulfite exporter TauE/SafE family protein n=1 Tax=Bordetella sp. FB-8 TaxID=1159870 RepID=UPI00037BD978|nr:sulfite exporter TauE/SafE family protein [Bordetella sp. FB-8]
MHNIAFVIAGFGVGLIVGLTGVGGGSLMTPVLVVVFGMKPYLAVGTDLLFAACTKLGGTVSLARQGLVPWPVVARLCAGSVPAALVSLWVLHRMGPNSVAAQHIMTTALGGALLLTAIATFYKAIAFSRHAKPRRPEPATPQETVSAMRARHGSLPVLLGAAIGTLVTFTSVGAGAIGVTVLLLIFPLLPLPRIIAADIAYAVPLTFVAGLGHATLGTVNWPVLALLLVGSLPGIWLGSRLVARAHERLIRAGLSVLLVLAGAKLISI